MAKRVHFISGLTITIFIVFHLINHVYSLFGVERHIELMNLFRLVYRNALAETILLLSVLVQIVSGIKLFNRSRKVVHGFWKKLQLWSGLYLAIFFVFHLGAVFLGRLVLNLDTNIFFGVAGLNTFPFNLFFIPYYGLAIVSFFGHIAAIHVQKSKRPIFGITPNKQSSLILVFGILLTITILFGLTGRFQGIEIPSEYDVMLGK
ncbi:hypothetical protein [uncultured Roseivirga sp.]|uniref:hypothetical protein n=1 Tax=uncultured Roseivirga sp. TaxID=543088 RepID=UPI0030D7A285|tara:strand:- start:166 stop:780 length:615 start_codon:yes stop_codon:yes gene_type:complete